MCAHAGFDIVCAPLGRRSAHSSMSFDNPLLRRKKTGEDLDPAKLKAALQSRNADGAKAAFVLSDLEDMKLADVRKYLRLRNLNPLGGLVEAKERLRESLQAEVDAANANVSSIQYRQAAREAREAGQLPISLHYDKSTHDAMMGPLNLHSTAEYTKESKIRLKKDRKLKQRVVHQFNVPGGRMKAGFINVVNKGWGHEALEYVRPTSFHLWCLIAGCPFNVVSKQNHVFS